MLSSCCRVLDRRDGQNADTSFSADIIGRKYAFNTSLFISSVAAILAGAMPNWASLGFFIALLGFGAGGNLILDTTVFLEYLPGNKQWAVTFLACWWGLGQAITGFIGWGFLGTSRSVMLDVGAPVIQPADKPFNSS
jgi:MFS family permease